MRQDLNPHARTCDQPGGWRTNKFAPETRPATARPARRILRGITGQLMLLVVAATIPLAGLVGYEIFLEADKSQEQAIAHVQDVARDVAEDIKAYIEGARERLEYLSNRPAVRALDSTRCDSLITDLPQMMSAYASVILVDGGGRVVCSSAGASAIGASFADREWFQNGLRSTGFRVAIPVLGRLTRQLWAPLTVPIRDEAGANIGVLTTGLSLREVTRLIARSALPARSVVTVVSRGGTIIARSLDPDKWLGTDGRRIAAIAAQLEQREGVATFRGVDGVERIHAFRTIPGIEWLVSAAVPMDAVMASYRRSLVQSGSIAMAVIAVTLVAAFALARRIRRPIHSLEQAARAAAAGNFSSLADEAGPDEIVTVAREFNRMQTARARYETELLTRQEQLEAANKELESFSYSVSHDLRVPLRAVDGFSHMLERKFGDGLGEEGHRLVSVVRDNTRRMGRLIDDILAFSRMGRKEMSLDEVDMTALARAAAEEVMPTTGRAGRKFDLRIDTLPCANGDHTMLRQVWINLIGNAVKFTRPKPIAQIEIGARVEAGEQVYYVKDNGVGFDMQYAHKLFGVFQRLHGVQEFEGTGIGLAIVNRIVTRHGGRVWAEAKVNGGASFYFTLPKAGPPIQESNVTSHREEEVLS